MGEVASSYVSIYPKITADFSGQLHTQMQTASKGAFGPIDKQADESGKKSGKKFGDGFRSVAAPILTLAAVGALARFVDNSVSAFNEFEDASSAAAVTFGASMDRVRAVTDGAAKSMGMSKTEATNAAITYGTFAKAAGLAGDGAADFSTRMVQLAADMASFRGTTPEQAVEAIGAAMRGESDPIEQYGVLLNDAMLRNEALRLGLIKTTKEALSPQQRILAAQSAILAQTTQMQGDYNRTAEQGGNVQKTLRAESTDLAVEIGEKLQPAIVSAQKAGIGFIQWVTDNQAAILPLVATVGTLTAAVAGFVAVSRGIEALKEARQTLVGLGDAFQQMSTKARIATASAGAVGIALAGASIVYGIFAQKNAEAQQRVQDFTAAVKADSGALGENSRAVAANALQKSGALTAAQKLGLSSKVAVDAALGEAGAMAEVSAAYERHVAWIQAVGAAQASEATGLSDQRTAMLDTKAALTEAGDAYNRLRTEIGLTAPAAQEALTAEKQVAEATGDATSVTKTNTAATDDNTSATKANSAATKTNAQRLNDLYDARLKLRGDRRSFQAAIDDATKAVKENGRTLDIHTEKGRANQEALDGIADAGRDYVQSLKDQKRPSAEVREAMRESRVAFVNAATAMGKAREDAVKLADKLGLIKSKKVDVTASVKMNPNADQIVYSVAGHGTVKFSARRRGGPAGGLTLVGEEGPELVDLPDGSFVHTAAKTAAILKRSLRLQGRSEQSPADQTTAAPTTGPNASDLATALADVLQARGMSWLLVSDRIAAVRTLAEEMA